MAAQDKFSLQTAWLVVKVLPRGYLLRLACSGRTRLWLEYGENVSGTNIKTKHSLSQHIFEGGTTYFPECYKSMFYDPQFAISLTRVQP